MAEFETLAAIVRGTDERIDAAADKEAAWLSIVEPVIPAEVLAEVGIQRALRVLGIDRAGQLREQTVATTKVSAAWLDGFIAGAQYQDRKR